MESKQICLNLGCGVALKAPTDARHWINVDAAFTLEQLKSRTGFMANAVVPPDAIFHQANIIELPFEDDYADYALLDNVIEHLPWAFVPVALDEIRRVLRPGGELCVIAPDFNCLAKMWSEQVGSKVGDFQDWSAYHELAECIYGNQAGVTWGEFHCVPITPDFLNHRLAQAGFTDIVVTCYPMHSTIIPEGDPDIKWPPGTRNRFDSLKATCRKPAAPSSLSIRVSDGIKVKGGMA